MIFSFDRIDPSLREPISTEIARRLIDFLLAGHLQPGERLASERQLATDLGVGRSAVREAIKSLALLGLLEVRQGDGTYLRRTDTSLPIQKLDWGVLLGVHRTRALVEARRYLEIAVAELAATRRDAAAVVDLRARFTELERSVGQVERFIAADVAFHLAIAEASDNEILRRMPHR